MNRSDFMKPVIESQTQTPPYYADLFRSDITVEEIIINIVKSRSLGYSSVTVPYKMINRTTVTHTIPGLFKEVAG